MENKLSKKNIKLCIGLLILLLLVATYQFGYVKYNDKRKEVVNTNNTLQAQLNELNIKALSRADYEADIIKMNQELDNILDNYGPAAPEENIIVMLRDMELQTGVQFSTASFADSNIIYSSAESEDSENRLIVQETLINTVYRCTYEGLKEMLNYINGYKNRMNIENITVSYDRETGNLTGSMMLNLYSVISVDKTYEAPTVGGIDIGMKNIFATSELPINQTPNNK